MRANVPMTRRLGARLLMQLPLVVALTVSSTLVAARAADAPSGTNDNIDFGWTSHCSYTASAMVDPIVAPGGPSSHLHDFFGTRPDPNSTVGSLQAGGTTCALKQDTAGYWVPSLYLPDAQGVYVQQPPTSASIYYNSKLNGGPVAPFPSNLKMIAGNSHAAPRSQSLGVVWFDCGPGHGTFSHKAMEPYACPADKFVRAHAQFPACWDSTTPWVIGDDSSHMAYAQGPTCPAGWIRVPALHLLVTYPAHDGTGARLSSGGGPAEPNSIYTFHADFFQAWNQTALTRLVNGCLNEVVEKNCGTPRTPTVKSLSPSKGKVGTKITIAGRAFSGVKSVTFNGKAAAFTVVSTGTVTATVPKGATTGMVAVTTDGGTGTGLRTTGFSTTNFTVTN